MCECINTHSVSLEHDAATGYLAMYTHELGECFDVLFTKFLSKECWQSAPMAAAAVHTTPSLVTVLPYENDHLDFLVA